MKYSYIFLLLHFLFLNKTEAQVKCPKGINSEDAAQLKKLYDATNGGKWRYTKNWNNLDSLNWRGVKWLVNQDECRVESISLYNNNLTSNLPNDLQFPFLQTLDLSVNDLIGQIPDFNFVGLKNLDLSRNEFTGTIPLFSNLKDLETLNLSVGNNSKIDGILPLFEFPKLKTLGLSNINIRGKTPVWNFPLLEVLNLSFAKFDTINEQIMLPNLKRLNLSDCPNLHGDVSVFHNSKKLNDLNISSTKIGLGAVKIFDNLEYLNMSRNELSGEILGFLLPTLKKLDISSNEYSGSLAFIEKMPRLEIFIANNNQFQSLDFQTPSSTLKEFYISGNHLRDCMNQIDFSRLTKLDVRLNWLDFGDFSKMKISKSTDFAYNIQYPINFKVDYSFGNVATLYTGVGNPKGENTYKWSSNKSTNLVADNLRTNDTLFVPFVSGVYNCTIINPRYPELTIRTNDQFVITDNDERPGDFVIHPNISNGFFNVHFYRFVPYNIKFRVYNANGELIFTKEKSPAPSEVDFDLSNLPNGVYFLEVNSSVKKSIEKFVISK